MSHGHKHRTERMPINVHHFEHGTAGIPKPPNKALSNTHNYFVHKEYK